MAGKLNFLILTCLFGILLPSIINAQDVGGDTNGKLTVHEIVTGIILILTGIAFCFFGKRFYRATLFLVGFYIGAIIAWVALSNGEPSGGFTAGAANHTIILLVSIAVGFLVGLIFMCCATVAVWLLGALAGYILALFILSWKSDGLITSKPGRIIFIVVLTLIGLLLTCFFKNAVIILSTAFIGAYAIILGIDLFVKTGFAQSVRLFMDGNHDVSYTTNTKVYLMLGGMVALFIIGSIVQFRYHKNNFAPVVVQPGEKRNFLPWRNRKGAV